MKKYHPDVNQDEAVQKIYTEITIKLTKIINDAKLKGDAASPPPGGTPPIHPARTQGKDIAPVRDQGYAYYKLGITYYRNIHPDQFYKKHSPNPYEPVTYEEQMQALNRIFASFRLAEYFFHRVVQDYPESLWARDAAAKIRLLKKLHKTYDDWRAEDSYVVNPANIEAFMREMDLHRG